LLEAIKTLNPTAIIISGDFTQRATLSQFRAAESFLSKLTVPCLAVPGNHDISLHNVFERLFFPYKKYRQYINSDLLPTMRMGNLFIAGLNSTHSLTISRPRPTRQSIDYICEFFSQATDKDFKVLVSHHSVVEMLQYDSAIKDLLDVGIHVSMCGHGHQSDVRVIEFAGSGPTLLAQAGTALSTRLRGENNTWNFFEVLENHIDAYVYTLESDAFIKKQVSRIAL
jgi:predicted MPP superfamily phosphohydrolase